MQSRCIHVLMAISNLDHGGAQRVVLNLLRHFDREKLKLTLMINKGGPLLPLVPTDVPIIELMFLPRIPQIVSGPFLVASKLKRLRPDVIITNLINIDFYRIFGSTH